ncbi:hypothetical protein LSH36_6g14005 [Paralvinella palmiformis]|uniref:DPY30 domain-containing protein 1 n=1 Tax=Paralvinella palmiformis TaxID=53620 RepID=A0AAD9KDV6_9ANNE|nr:hypothetical protein LSH36_6g14005 [Paralvinella palmiformis]
MDSDYLKTHLGKCLSDCLTEVSEKRPLDPIEYIAQWLYKHIDNIKNEKQEEEDKIKLKQEEEEFSREQERREKMKEEKRKLREEQAKKQQELQAQDTSGLPPLAEGEEPQETPRIQIEVKDDDASGEKDDASPKVDDASAKVDDAEEPEQQKEDEKTEQAPAEV